MGKVQHVTRRKAAGLGLKELASRVGCDVWTARRWEQGLSKSRYERRFLEVIAAAERQRVLSGVLMRAEREALGLTRQQLAEAAGVCARTIMEAELHQRGAGHTLRAITEALCELKADPARIPPPRARRARSPQVAEHVVPPPVRITKVARLAMIRRLAKSRR